jgi:hypothetical protein
VSFVTPYALCSFDLCQGLWPLQIAGVRHPHMLNCMLLLMAPAHSSLLQMWLGSSLLLVSHALLPAPCVFMCC